MTWHDILEKAKLWRLWKLLKRSIVARVWEKGRIKGQSTGEFRVGKLKGMPLLWGRHIIIHLPEPIECTMLRVNPDVNYGLRVITICHCGFINCNKCTTLVWDVDSWGSCVCVRKGSVWEFSVLSTPFCCEIKIKVHF